MKLIIPLFLFTTLLYANEIPLKDGSYIFTHRFAEHPNMESIKLSTTIKNGVITLTNTTNSDVFPLGIIENGKISWHQKSQQWIIRDSSEDLNAIEVGGCSDGPSVIDFKIMVYWSC